MESPKRKFNPQVETKLRRTDFDRLDELAKKENKTKSQVLREALLWYLQNKDQLKNAQRDAAIVLAINAMANRTCAMLARQGRQIGTVFELHSASMGVTPEGKEVFKATYAKSKQKQAQAMEQDEREVVESVLKTIKAAGTIPAIQ